MQDSSLQVGIRLALFLFIAGVGNMLWSLTGFWWVVLWGGPFLIIAPPYIIKLWRDAQNGVQNSKSNGRLTPEDRPFVVSFLVMVIGFLLSVYIAFGYRNIQGETLRLKRAYTLSILKPPDNLVVRLWLEKYVSSRSGLTQEIKSALIQPLLDDPAEVRAALSGAELEVSGGGERFRIRALPWIYLRLPEEVRRQNVSSNILARLIFFLEGTPLAPEIPASELAEQSELSLIAVLLCDPSLTGSEFQEFARFYTPAEEKSSLQPPVEAKPRLINLTMAVSRLMRFEGKGLIHTNSRQCDYESLSDSVKKEWAHLMRDDPSVYRPKIHYHIREFRQVMTETLKRDGFWPE